MATLSEAIKVTIDASAESFKKVMDSLPGIAKKSIGKVGQTVLGLTKTFLKLGTVITATFTGFAVLALKKSAEAEKAFANLAGLFRESIDELSEYKDAIDKLGVQYGVSTVEMTEAFYQSVSAGFRSIEDATGVVEAATKAAIAGSAELPTAVEAITRVLNAYNLAGTDAQKVSDLLFQTVNYGVTTFAELAPNIGIVAGMAAKAELSMEELFGAIATLTKQMPLAEAITSLNMVITGFLKPTEDARNAARSLGIDLSAAGLATHGLHDAMAKVADLSAEQQAELFPNIRALRGIMSMASDGAKEFEQNIGAMNEATGATMNAFGKQSDTLGHEWKTFWNGLNKAVEKFGDVFRDDVKNILSKVNAALFEDDEGGVFAWIDKFQDAYEAFKEDISSGRFGKTTKDIVMGMANKFKEWWNSEEVQGVIKKTFDDVGKFMEDTFLPIAAEIGKAIAKAMLDAFVAAWKAFDLGKFIFGSEEWGEFNIDWSPWVKNILGLQAGGVVHGPSGPDAVPARLTAGEYVVNPEAAAQHLPLLEAINQGASYHDVSMNTFNFGDRVDRRFVRDEIIPELRAAKRAGYGLDAPRW